MLRLPPRDIQWEPESDNPAPGHPAPNQLLPRPAIAHAPENIAMSSNKKYSTRTIICHVILPVVVAIIGIVFWTANMNRNQICHSSLPSKCTTVEGYLRKYQNPIVILEHTLKRIETIQVKHPGFFPSLASKKTIDLQKGYAAPYKAAGSILFDLQEKTRSISSISASDLQFRSKAEQRVWEDAVSQVHGYVHFQTEEWRRLRPGLVKISEKHQELVDHLRQIIASHSPGNEAHVHALLTKEMETVRRLMRDQFQRITRTKSNFAYSVDFSRKKTSNILKFIQDNVPVRWWDYFTWLLPLSSKPKLRLDLSNMIWEKKLEIQHGANLLQQQLDILQAFSSIYSTVQHELNLNTVPGGCKTYGNWWTSWRE